MKTIRDRIHRLGGIAALVATVACAPAAPPVAAPQVGGPPAVAIPPIPQLVPRPAQVIGFEPGDDYRLADYTQLVAYYEALAAASDRVQLVEIGRTTRDRPMYVMVVSAAENLMQLERWRSISTRLGRAEGLTDVEARRLAREGKVIVWINAGLHSTEVAASQHIPHLAYHLATDESEESRRIREDVVLLLMPVMNPDGHEVVVDWYRRNLGTPYETSAPPELYHEYVGHDINRDWFMFRQAETHPVARILYHEWLPQVVFDHHQTAPFPARIFIPPFADPVNPHIDPRVVRSVNLVGDQMANRFEMERMPGVVSRMSFTMWWNGGMRTAPYFHNQIGILSEVGHASATPAHHDPAEFASTFGRGSQIIPTLEPTVFYPNPWPGGRASIGDAVRYHLVASLGALDAAQKNREPFLYNFYLMGRDAIAAGSEGGPFAYVVSLGEQHDPGEALEMLTALHRGGVEVHRATAAFDAGGRRFPAGSFILYAGQAFRAHLLDLMEPQEHPHRETFPGGPPEPPYGGLAGYTLPIQMGVEAVRVEEPFRVDATLLERIPAPEARLAGSGGTVVVGPAENRSFTLLSRALEEGIEVSRSAEAFELDGRPFPAGTLVLDLGAARAGVAEGIIADAGLTAIRTAAAPPVPMRPVRQSRIAIYQSWVPNMDEGWTRWLLDHYGIPYEIVRDPDVRQGDLSRFDAILLADQGVQSILGGHRVDSRPAEFTGGLGEEGVEALRRFVEGGGRLVALDNASNFVLQHFDLPVRNTLTDLPSEEFFIPGSLIRLAVDTAHPLAFGMQEESAAFFQGSQAFAVTGERAEVVVRYGSADLLLSGWEVGAAEHLTDMAAVVRAPIGFGDVVLIGFRSQFRAQPAGTFKLLFNALQGAAEGTRAAEASRASAAAAGR